MKRTDEKFNATPFLKAPAPPFHITQHGALFADDCMKILPLLKDGMVDTVFADPPFNLGKEYGKRTDDSLPDDRYIQWCREYNESRPHRALGERTPNEFARQIAASRDLTGL